MYCTARIDGAANPSGHADQDVYLKALLATGSVDHIEYGTYVSRVKTAPLAVKDSRGRPQLVGPTSPVMIQDGHGGPVNGAVFMMSYANQEKKGSDVNVAEYRMPGMGTPVPAADAVLACPLTFNSVNKFAHGHADNFAVGLLCEMAGYGVPVVVVPHCKPQLASHPAFAASLETLRGMGVRVLFDPDAPYERRLPPWSEVIDALPVRAGAS